MLDRIKDGEARAEGGRRTISLADLEFSDGEKARGSWKLKWLFFLSFTLVYDKMYINKNTSSIDYKIIRIIF
jgi:hypothetical protein